MKGVLKVSKEQEVLDDLDDFASTEKQPPSEWKKTHPESHSMVHFIKLRQTSLNFTKLCGLLQTEQSYTEILQKLICV